MENKVYMIGELRTGKIFNFARESFTDNITFQSFFPKEYVAENFRSREMGDRRGMYYTIVEAEIISYENEVLTVAYESFCEVAPF